MQIGAFLADIKKLYSGGEEANVPAKKPIKRSEAVMLIMVIFIELKFSIVTYK